MIISHKHKFIFVKTKKTAGTSFEIALSKICGPQDILTPIDSRAEIARKEFANISAQNYFLPFHRYNKRNIFNYLARNKKLPLRFYPHTACREIKQLIPKKIWNEYYKFTIERNPFDKIVSLYYWRGGDKKFGNIHDFLLNGGLKDFSSYDLYAIDGIMAVDQIYRYEDLAFACEDLSKRLQLATTLEMPLYKAKSDRRKIQDYRAILDEKSIELIRLIFAREIRLLKYKF